MIDTFNAAMGYLGRARGIQTKDQYHRMFPNIILKGKLGETVRFVCTRETRGFLQPEKLVEDLTGIINKTTASVL